MSGILRIGICDDEKQFRDRLSESITKICMKQGIENSIVHFGSGEELLEGYLDLDILFLDIQMDGMNGIETAKTIRKKDENVCIVFISAYPEYAAEGYKVHAFRYITKPFDDRELEAELLGAIRETGRVESISVTVKNDKGTFRIKSSNILFIEVRDRHSVIHTTEGEVASKEALGKFETMLNGNFFFRCHQGYLVNLRYVNCVIENSVTLHGDWVLPLSRYRKKELVSMMAKYWGGLM